MLSMRQERSGGEGLRLKAPQRCGTYFERKMPFPKNVFRTSNSNTVKRQYGEIEWTVVEKRVGQLKGTPCLRASARSVLTGRRLEGEVHSVAMWLN